MNDADKGKQLPALLKPAHTLTEESMNNMVQYEVKGNTGTIYCEDAFIVDGWLTMKLLRIKTYIETKVEPIHLVGWSDYSNSNLRTRFTCARNNKVSRECYYTQKSKVILAAGLQVINSFNEEQTNELPLWSRTSKEEAQKSADEFSNTENDKIRVRNQETFSRIINNELDFRFREKFRKVWANKSWFNKKFFCGGTDKRGSWITDEILKMDEKTKGDALQEVIDDVKKEYHRMKIEWKGSLDYKPEK